jgi:hypothetical protein
MTPHTHREYVEGCFRCDLSRDEVAVRDPLAVFVEAMALALPWAVSEEARLVVARDMLGAALAVDGDVKLIVGEQVGQVLGASSMGADIAHLRVDSPVALHAWLYAEVPATQETPTPQENG